MKLFEIAQARSGDKGNSVNVGVIAFTALGYEFIKKEMTINKIENYFENTLFLSKARRFEIPALLSLNFVLDQALGHGSPSQFRTDSQGKTLGCFLLQMNFPNPRNILEMRRNS